MTPVLILAEPGHTHEGQLDKMLALIHVAKQAGADVIKFGWTSDPQQLAARRHVEDWTVYKRIAFPAEWHLKLWTACQEAGIEYACTVYLKRDLQVVSLFVQRFKVASFEATDHAFVRANESFGKPVFVSTGMQNAEELAWLLRRRKRNPNIKLLHCVSAYPTPLDELNLGAIRQYALDGFSDHAGFMEVGAFAVSAGARIVEVHFRLEDCEIDNPDFRHSLPPPTLEKYVSMVRAAEQAMGDGVKRCMESEAPMRKHRVRGA